MTALLCCVLSSRCESLLPETTVFTGIVYLHTSTVLSASPAFSPCAGATVSRTSWDNLPSPSWNRRGFVGRITSSDAAAAAQSPKQGGITAGGQQQQQLQHRFRSSSTNALNTVKDSAAAAGSEKLGLATQQLQQQPVPESGDDSSVLRASFSMRQLRRSATWNEGHAHQQPRVYGCSADHEIPASNAVALKQKWQKWQQQQKQAPEATQLGPVTGDVSAETSCQLLHPSAFLKTSFSADLGSSVMPAPGVAEATATHHAIARLAEVLSSALTPADPSMDKAPYDMGEQYYPGFMFRGPTAGVQVQRLLSEGSGSYSSGSPMHATGNRLFSRPPGPDGQVALADAGWDMGARSAAGLGTSAAAATSADSDRMQVQQWEDAQLALDDAEAAGTNLLVVPTEPATIFEATIGARPNFENRELPPGNYWYMAINGFVLLVLILGAIVEVVTGKALS